MLDRAEVDRGISMVNVRGIGARRKYGAYKGDERCYSRRRRERKREDRVREQGKIREEKRNYTVSQVQNDRERGRERGGESRRETRELTGRCYDRERTLVFDDSPVSLNISSNYVIALLACIRKHAISILLMHNETFVGTVYE